jgi:O-antigen/teichoic acid export membrane protein
MSDETRAAEQGSSILMRIVRNLTLMGFRGLSTVAKFILTLYTARFLGLADLGVYGLVAAAAAFSPAVLGFGLTDWVARRIVLAERTEAMQKIIARLSVSCAAHLVFQPLVWAANIALGEPVPISWVWFIAPIVLFEHLASEVHDLLIARGRITLTSTLQFIRAALWPLAVVGIGLLFPETRTLETIFIGWLCGLILTAVVLVGWLLLQRIPLHFRWADFAELAGHVRQSFPLYVRDIANTSSLFIDRYLISLTLGLELTGVYVFFWQVANVVYGMTNTVIVQPQAAKMIAAVGRDDAAGLRELRKKLRIEASAWTAVLSVAVFIATIVLLPYLQRPELYAYLAVFGVILLASAARNAADEYGFILLALHRDRAILVTSVTGALLSAALNAVLVPTVGLWGAAIAFLLTGLTVLTLRLVMSRPQQPPLPSQGLRV